MNLNRLFCSVVIFLQTTAFSGKIFSEQDTAEKKPSFSVAILGDSYSYQESFNKEVLKVLFRGIDKQNPRAVFFTGNLTFGVHSNETFPKLIYRIPSEKTILKDKKDERADDLKAFAQRLNEFKQIKQQELGDKILFYPLMGNQELIGPEAVRVFKETFGIKNASLAGPGELVYTVSLGDAYFIVLATDYYDVENGKSVEHQISTEALEWLENVLKEQSDLYHFVFVIGNEPAFSTTANYGHYQGLDANRAMRDRFWKILKDYHVLAYFCSHEHLYDRTVHDGVWQIISGGGGAPLDSKDGSKAFYHYLMLSIPTEIGLMPKVIVKDLFGNVRDEFPLNYYQNPIYQKHISGPLE